ncbi:ATP-binding protein [Mesorhizobium sp. B4-1-4]|uniref:ATP-binding protein n=1 Tax=Mesorhizobium sp. B4-1-4 TaxID=2589888 RepID=UPI001D0058AD|nr:ATP-binding protein [Mesorhizobium sp. B4-1-4]UCI29450.1 ATP-binding protein [Mesorhizobium sp. B4-1-4]
MSLNDRVQAVLQRNGFLSNTVEDRYRTTIPISEFSLDGGVDFSRYTNTHLERREMPKMTNALRGKFYEGLDEIFANCSLHSNSECQVCVGGQFYPQTEKIAFSIADGGRGIDGAFRAAKGRDIRPDDAIDWAMQPGSTTRSGDLPGGLGLKLIREFVRLNGGKITVVSNAGVWCQSGGNVTKAILSSPFPGTAVIFEIVTSDRKQYDLAKAPHPRDIW